MKPAAQRNANREHLQAVATICRKTLGWWTVAEFSAFAKDKLIELNVMRAAAGHWPAQRVPAN